MYQRLRAFFESRIFTLMLILLSASFVVLEKEVYGAIVLLNIGAVVLLFCKNILTAFMPALLACTFVIKCYDSLNVFLPLWYTAVFPVFAVIAFLIFRRKKITVGKSFIGIVCVAAAVTLGGFFDISAKDYFSPSSLYYVIALGVGMAAAYLILRSHMTDSGEYDIFEKFADLMVVFGAFASFVVLEYYLKNIGETFALQKLANIQWSNNISTMLMMAMPFPIYKMKKSIFYFPLFLLNYGAILLAGSRGGWLMGSILFLLCLCAGCFICGKGMLRKLTVLLFGIAFMICAVYSVFMLSEYGSGDVQFVPKDEARIKLFKRSIEDFMDNPLFGKGLGNRANTDLYNGKQGTMIWYHMMIPQIVGSLGVVGIVCYMKQIADRVAMIFKRRDSYSLTLGLFYVGIFLMSQVNPGEFCPLPYELLTVIGFIVLERYNEKNELSH